MSHTLLLADDSVTTQRVLELTFAEHGVRVVGVTDGEQALEQLKTERPDIVLVDVGLAKVNGYKLAAHITQQPSLAGVPVLLLVGAFDSVDENRVTQSGAAGTLVKPLESSIVIKRVKELLGLAGRERAAAPADLPPVTASDPPPPPPSASQTAPSESQAPAALSPWDEILEKSGLSGSAANTGAQQSGDDYLDRLDAAFDTLDAKLAGRSLQKPAVAPAPIEARPVEPAPIQPIQPVQPTPPPVIEPPPPPASAAPPPPPPAAPVAAPYRVADAFESLLAAEQGEAPPVVAPVMQISDEVIERIAVRVAERLTEGVLIDAVKDIVAAVAERQVSEEIARIRAAAKAKRQ